MSTSRHYFSGVRLDTYWVRIDLCTHATLALYFCAGTYMSDGLLGVETRMLRGLTMSYILCYDSQPVESLSELSILSCLIGIPDRC